MSACIECGITAHALKKCPCLKVQYCSETCQKKAWKTHKTTCNGIKPSAAPAAMNVMVRNSAGGASYVVTDWTRLMRFIFLGAEGPTYYTSGKELFHGNAVAIKRLLTTDGPKVVQLVEDISVKGDAAKQDNLLFVLAMAARLGNEPTRRVAYEKLSKICRIPTHWFTFLNFSTQMIIPSVTVKKTIKKKAGKNGKGQKMTKKQKQEAQQYEEVQLRALDQRISKKAQEAAEQAEPSEEALKAEKAEPAPKAPKEQKASKASKASNAPMLGKGWGCLAKQAFSKIYNGKAEDVAYAITKYKNREGWSHLDVLRLAHVLPKDAQQSCLFKYIRDGPTALVEMPEGKTKAFLLATEAIKTPGLPLEEALRLIKTHRLAREHIPTPLLKNAEIWRVLLQEMPLTALLRNLTKMTSLGVLGGSETANVVHRLTNPVEIKKARLHPFNILVALKTYASGGEAGKGSVRCDPLPAIQTALNQAFDLAFANVEPTGKRFVLGMDVSGSMSGGGVIGSPIISPRVAAAAMAMCFMRKEPACTPIAFSGNIVPFPMNPRMPLETVCGLCDRIPFGSTYCDLPMTWAMENQVAADVFLIFTDCETSIKRFTPAQALKQYREKMGIPAKLIVFGFTSTGFTLADPEDRGMMDMVGFDASAPEVVRRFILDEI